MNRKLVFVLAAGLALMSATAWAAYPPAARSVGDPSRYRYMYCRTCDREQPYDRVLPLDRQD